MIEFKSWRSYWNFARATKNKARYIHSEEVKDFLHTVLETSKDQEAPTKKGSVLWRAQLGHDFRPCYQDGELMGDIECPHPHDRMKPRVDRAIEGRANPKGIPYLYLSTSKETALSEVRPWVGSLISVGQFRILRDLVVIDCSKHHGETGIYFEEPDPETRARAVWSGIDTAFSAPVNPTDDVADYVPTQIIAELFKDKGYDGIAYRNAFGGEGYNVALFDIEAAKLANCFLYKAKSIRFEFEEASEPYFIKKDDEK